ncbi:hypothetical protein P4S72_11125 [Vibrio sp. PP-XX7]
MIEQPELSDDALMCQLSRGMVTYLARTTVGICRGFTRVWSVA